MGIKYIKQNKGHAKGKHLKFNGTILVKNYFSSHQR